MKVFSVLKCFKRKNTVMPLDNSNSNNSVISVLSDNWVDSNEIENNKNECTICLENDIELDLTLPCMHRFHKKCVNNWYNQSRNLWCPICKTSFKKQLIEISNNENNLRYNTQLNEPLNFQLNLTNQNIQIPIAPANTPPRIARFRLYRSRLNRVNVSS